MSPRDSEPQDIEKRIADAVRAMTLPRAPESARAAARRAFFQGTGARIVGVPASPRRFLPALIPLAAAAALAFAYIAGSRPSERWIVTGSVNRHEVSLAKGCGETGEVVHPGRVAVGPKSTLDVQLGDGVRLRLLPGTVMDIPQGPGVWFQRTATVRVVEGEIHGTTGGDALAYAVRIETPEAAAVLTGTTFALQRTEEATCFCLLEGRVAIASALGTPVDLPPGHHVFFYRDGRMPYMEPLPTGEREALSRMYAEGIVAPVPTPP